MPADQMSKATSPMKRLTTRLSRLGDSIMTHAHKKKGVEGPALQVVCLGAGGGPSEDNVTGFLVRAMEIEGFRKCSYVAVDAGSHLAAITRILESDFPLVAGRLRTYSATTEASAPSPGADALCAEEDSNSNLESERSASPEPTVLAQGPFSGASFPHRSARANAVHFVREHVDAYLITHPHLDHLSGFAINTASFHNTSRPKRLAALPPTVNAIKQHIFNDIIWPNLTDEDDGVGLVTFQRLTEGGNLALGEGNSRGFIEVVDGLAVKAFKVSHGTCAGTPKHDGQLRRGSNPNNASAQNQLSGHHLHLTPHSHNRSTGHPPNTPTIQNSATGENGRRSSVFSQPSQPGTPTFYGQSDGPSPVVDSTAFFIRADASGREILIFGDVEPDSISICPRTHIVWAEAAPKIASGHLSGIFIECSYTDAQQDAVLFGHLAPRHLIAELQSLAEMVSERRKELAEKAGKKRKRLSTLQFAEGSSSRSRRVVSRGSAAPMNTGHDTMKDVDSEEATPSKLAAGKADGENHFKEEAPLKDVRVIIIHVKDSMMDGPLVGDVILTELRAHEERLILQGRPLGCVFEVSRSGSSYSF